MSIKVLIIFALICAVAAVPKGVPLKQQTKRISESISDSDSDSSDSSDSSELEVKQKPAKTTTRAPTKRPLVKSANVAPAAVPAPAEPAKAFVAPKMQQKIVKSF